MIAFLEHLSAPAWPPEHLAAPPPERLPTHWRGCLFLLLLCLIPRIWAASRLPAICPDGPLYLDLAQSLARGEWSAAVREMNLNMYPFALAGMHALGFDWETGAMVWGIGAASLAALPLFGWVRRMFGTRAGYAAGVLYALQPKLVAVSPEIYREPTFWLLLTLALYLLWRAFTEGRWHWFLLAGIACTLATLTRVEGLFLALPALVWLGRRWFSGQVPRYKLAVGMLLAIGFLPAVVIVANLVLFRGQSHVIAFRTTPLKLVQVFAERVQAKLAGGSESSAAAAEVGQPLYAQKSLGKRLSLYGMTLRRGISDFYIFLLLWGIWYARKRWILPEHQATFWMAMAVFAGMWVHLNYAQETSSRYTCSVVILGMPFAAMAILSNFDAAWHVARTTFQSESRQRACFLTTSAAWVLAIAITSMFMAAKQEYDSREIWAETGRWIEERSLPEAVVVGSRHMESLVGYYSRRNYRTFPTRSIQPEQVVQFAQEWQANLVLLLPAEFEPASFAACQQQLTDHGFAPVFHVPGEFGQFMLYARQEEIERLAAGPLPQHAVPKRVRR